MRVASCKSSRVRWWLLGWSTLATGLLACGPFLPEQVLLARRAVLRTPVGDFAREVAALRGVEDAAPALPPGTEQAVQPCLARDWNEETGEERPGSQLEAETAEFTAALDRRGVPGDHRDTLLAAYKTYRAAVEERDPSSQNGGGKAGNLADIGYNLSARAGAGTPSPTPAPSLTVPAPLAAALPEEWVDYLQGADCFHAGDMDGARQCWERLLARPQPERLDRSVWAAFMLARMLEGGSTPAESAARYQRVRELRAAGCRDRLNLAAASLGWEARLALNADDHSQAARLYYLQAQAGTLDGDSLRTVAYFALGEGKNNPTMLASARDPFLRRMVTLYLACSRGFGGDADPTDTEQTSNASDFAAPNPADDPEQRPSTLEWLEILKSIGVDNVHEAANVAWAAYERGAYIHAADWLKLAPVEDALALWLRAKLALRAGKNDEAAREFSQAIRAFPAEASIGNELDDTGRARNGRRFRSQQFHMDLGTLQLSRGDFKQALASLLRSGFWSDAAYVAEQVLTVEELSRYVRENYPSVPVVREPRPEEREVGVGDSEEDKLRAALADRTNPRSPSDQMAFFLRYLLARRLARLGRYADARRYYPAVLLPRFDEYVAACKTGGTTAASREKRAAAYWRAARIERYLGMELFGTEVGPDWYTWGGSFEQGDYREARLGLPSPSPDPAQAGVPTPSPSPSFVPPVGAQEKRRITREETQPFKRYHYRYLAAELAWKAASLMPDQQEGTAKVLATGGLWLESVDETKAADRFYLAMLRRCNRTALGQEADKSGKLPDVPREQL